MVLAPNGFSCALPGKRNAAHSNNQDDGAESQVIRLGQPMPKRNVLILVVRILMRHRCLGRYRSGKQEKFVHISSFTWQF
jgi:hypothetical protein